MDNHNVLISKDEQGRWRSIRTNDPPDVRRRINNLKGVVEGRSRRKLPDTLSSLKQATECEDLLTAYASSQDRGTGDETVVSNARLQLERISSRLYMDLLRRVAPDVPGLDELVQEQDADMKSLSHDPEANARMTRRVIKLRERIRHISKMQASGLSAAGWRAVNLPPHSPPTSMRDLWMHTQWATGAGASDINSQTVARRLGKELHQVLLDSIQSTLILKAQSSAQAALSALSNLQDPSDSDAYNPAIHRLHRSHAALGKAVCECPTDNHIRASAEETLSLVGARSAPHAKEWLMYNIDPQSTFSQMYRQAAEVEATVASEFPTLEDIDRCRSVLFQLRNSLIDTASRVQQKESLSESKTYLAMNAWLTKLRKEAATASRARAGHGSELPTLPPITAMINTPPAVYLGIPPVQK